MIISLILKFFLFLIDAVAKICAFLLVSLGLWVPALFAVFYIIFCAVSGIGLGEQALTIMFVGMIVSEVIYIAVKIQMNKVKKAAKIRQNEKQRSLSKVKKKFEKPQENASNNINAVSPFGTEPAQSYKGSEYVIMPEFSQQSINNTDNQNMDSCSNDSESNNYKVFEGVHFIPNRPAENSNSVGIKQVERSEADLRQQERPVDNSSQNANNYFADSAQAREKKVSTYGEIKRTLQRVEEKPMIFSTRKDPSMVIYEYSDRLQFYKKTSRGLELLATEYKDKGKS